MSKKILTLIIFGWIINNFLFFNSTYLKPVFARECEDWYSCDSDTHDTPMGSDKKDKDDDDNGVTPDGAFGCGNCAGHNYNTGSCSCSGNPGGYCTQDNCYVYNRELPNADGSYPVDRFYWQMPDGSNGTGTQIGDIYFGDHGKPPSETKEQNTNPGEQLNYSQCPTAPVWQEFVDNPANYTLNDSFFNPDQVTLSWPGVSNWGNSCNNFVPKYKIYISKNVNQKPNTPTLEVNSSSLTASYTCPDSLRTDLHYWWIEAVNGEAVSETKGPFYFRCAERIRCSLTHNFAAYDTNAPTPQLESGVVSNYNLPLYATTKSQNSIITASAKQNNAINSNLDVEFWRSPLNNQCWYGFEQYDVQPVNCSPIEKVFSNKVNSPDKNYSYYFKSEGQRSQYLALCNTKGSTGRYNAIMQGISNLAGKLIKVGVDYLTTDNVKLDLKISLKQNGVWNYSYKAFTNLQSSIRSVDPITGFVDFASPTIFIPEDVQTVRFDIMAKGVTESGGGEKVYVDNAFVREVFSSGQLGDNLLLNSGFENTNLKEYAWDTWTDCGSKESNLTSNFVAINIPNNDQQNYWLVCSSKLDDYAKCTGNPFMSLPSGWWQNCGENSRLVVSRTGISNMTAENAVTPKVTSGPQKLSLRTSEESGSDWLNPLKIKIKTQGVDKVKKLLLAFYDKKSVNNTPYTNPLTFESDIINLITPFNMGGEEYEKRGFFLKYELVNGNPEYYFYSRFHQQADANGWVKLELDKEIPYDSAAFGDTSCNNEHNLYTVTAKGKTTTEFIWTVKFCNRFGAKKMFTPVFVDYGNGLTDITSDLTLGRE